MTEGHHQSDKHWNRFKGHTGEISERQGGAHMGFSERIDTILSWSKTALTCISWWSCQSAQPAACTPLAALWSVCSDGAALNPSRELVELQFGCTWYVHLYAHTNSSTLPPYTQTHTHTHTHFHTRIHVQIFSLNQNPFVWNVNW